MYDDVCVQGPHRLYLERAQKKALEKRARETGKSVGQLVCEAINESYGVTRPIERPLSESDPLWSFAGAGESRETDISTNHDRYLYGSKE